MRTTFIYQGKPVTLTNHAREVMQERNLSTHDVIKTLQNYTFKLPMVKERTIYINEKESIGVITKHTHDAFLIITAITLTQTKLDKFREEYKQCITAKMKSQD